MNQKIYVCTGGCAAEISQAEYEKGLTQCGTAGCSHQGFPFEERLKCSICGKIFKLEEPHSH